MLSGRPALLPAILLAVQATAAPASPVVAQSGDQSVRAGAAFVAFVELDDPAAQVQWTRNGSPVAGASSAELVIDPVGTSNAGSYQATVVSGGITRQSRPAQLEITAQLLPPIGADQRGTVVIPGSLHHYDLYLPPGYSQGGTPMPIIFSDKGGAGGLVDQLRTVCREKRIILVGMSRCANGASWDTMAYMQRAILHDARQRLNFDPARLFVGGKSGGSWRSFDLAKGEASTVAGVFSINGWLGQQWSTSYDVYLGGLKVARATGTEDDGARYYLNSDRGFLGAFLNDENIRDWDFPGAHGAFPSDAVQRSIWDWLLSEVRASSAAERDAARLQQARWRARWSAGDSTAVISGVWDVLLDQPRTPLSHAASLIQREMLADQAGFTRWPLPDLSGRANVYSLAKQLDFIVAGSVVDPLRPGAELRTASSAIAAIEAIQNAASVSNPATPYWQPYRQWFGHYRSLLDRWALEHRLDRHPGPTAAGDSDGDGIDNFAEFLHGLDPLRPDPPVAPSLRIRTGDGSAVLSQLIRQPNIDLEIEVLAAATPDAAFWSQVGGTPAAPGVTSDGSHLWRAGLPLSNRRAFFRTVIHNSPLWMDFVADGDNDDIPDDVDPFPGFDDRPPPTNGEPGPYLEYLLEHPGPQYHPALAGTRGRLLCELWTHLGTSTLDGFWSERVASPQPDVLLAVRELQDWPTLAEDAAAEDGHILFNMTNYGMRLRGYVVPPLSGSYTFYLAADDSARLKLSTTASPAARVQIASVDSWTGRRQFDKSASQTSAPVRLTAGQPCFVEVLVVNAGNYGLVNVEWLRPEGVRETIPAEALRMPDPAEITLSGPNP